jgi:hypothetical protein
VVLAVVASEAVVVVEASVAVAAVAALAAQAVVVAEDDNRLHSSAIQESQLHII